MKAKKLFFPEVVSKCGATEDMQLDLGNYAQETISVFRDLYGEKCTFQEYLSSCGLFASKCHVYVMSTQDDKEESSVPLQPKSNRRFWPGILLSTRQSRTTIHIAVGSIYGM